MHNIRLTPEQCWRFWHATVLCFVDFASTFNSVDRDCRWGIIAVERIPAKLLRLIKVYYASIKTKVRAC